METRLAVADDAETLAALHAASFGPTCWDSAQIAASLAAPATRGWLALQDDMPLGFLLCQIAGDEGEILTFCTAPAARRRGIGARLLRTVIITARIEKISRLFLEVAVDNAPALALYEKAGFRLIGRRLDYYSRDGQSVDATLLAFEL